MTDAQKKKIISDIRLFLFDMDGTLYLGDRLFGFAPELLETIRKSGRRYMFLTNNSSKSVKDYVAKLARLGISSVEDDFFTSSQATAVYLDRYHKGKTLYVCGTESLKAELRKAGYTVSEELENIEVVVMGFDTELTFKKLDDVSRLLTCRDLPYLATNPDLVCPTEYGSVPDCGSMCMMIKNATGKTPTVIGKPSPMMIELAAQKAGVDKSRVAVVGDRIYTDIKSGLNAGVHTMLVMSGETDERILAGSPDKPELVLGDASEILEALKQ